MLFFNNSKFQSSPIPVLMTIIIAVLFSSIYQQQILALSFSVHMEKPSGLDTGSSTSPRRVYASFEIYLTSDSVVTVSPGKITSITLRGDSDAKAQTAKMRTRSWSNVGTWDDSMKKMTVTVFSPVESISATETDAFEGFKEMDFIIPTNRRAWIREVRSRAYYQRLAEVYRETTARSRNDAKTQCQGQNGFLMTWLKPFEKEHYLNGGGGFTALSTATQWWAGSYATDNRPSNTFFCYRGDPDFIGSECKNEGYYADEYVASGLGAGVCTRPPGFGCLQGTYDFDGATVGSSTIISGRYVYSGGSWVMWDRLTTADVLYPHVCNRLESYKTKIPVTTFAIYSGGETPSNSLTKTKTKTRDPTMTKTRSHSLPTESFGTDSATKNVTRSSSKDTSSSTRTLTNGTKTLTPIVRPSPTHSLSLLPTESSSASPSFTRRTKTASKSSELSESRQLSESRELSSSVATPTTSRNIEASSTPTHSLVSTETESDDRLSLSPTKILPPPPAKATPALEDVETFALVASVVGGAAVVAVARARLMAAMSLSRCGTGKDLEDDMDALDNPLQIKFGTATLASQRGACFGNGFILLIFGVFMILVAVFVSWYAERTFWNALQRVRMPGILYLVLAIVTPGTAQATASLWQYGTFFSDVSLSIFSSVTIVFGPLVLILLVSLPGFCKSVLYKLPEQKDEDDADSDVDLDSFLNPTTGENSKNPEEKTSNDSDLTQKEEPLLAKKDTKNSDSKNNKHSDNKPLHQRFWSACVRSYNYWLVPERDWFDQDVQPPTQARQHASLRGDETERGMSGFTLKYGVIFEDFDRPLFGFFDLLVSTILGGASGFAIGVLSRPKCLFLLATATFACFTHLFYLVYYRLCLTRLMQWYMTINSLFTFLTVLFSTLLFLGQALDFDMLANVMTDLQTGVSLVTALLQILAVFVFFAEAYDAFRYGRDVHNRNKTSTFNLEDILNEHNNNNDDGEAIDLTEFLQDNNNENNNNSNDNEEVMSINLDEYEETDHDEDIILPDEEEDDDAIDLEIVSPPAEPEYALEDDDDDDGKHIVLDHDEEIELDEDGKPIGKASRANMEQYMELSKMLGEKG